MLFRFKQIWSLLASKILYILLLLMVLINGWLLIRPKIIERLVKPENLLSIQEITVRLKWQHQAQFAGMYVADQLGYYRDHGLKVNLLPFDFQNHPIDDVVSGKAHFGVTGAEDLLLARTQGKKIKAIAVIYQENPAVVYALSSTGIANIQDLKAKTIGMQSTGNSTEYIFKAMLEAEGLDYDKDIKKVDIGFEIQPVLDKKVDAAVGYVTNEVIQFEERDVALNIIYPSVLDISTYADVLFTTEDMIEQQPALVQKFVTATLKGWDEALAHPDQAVIQTLKYCDPDNPAQHQQHQALLLDRSIPLIKPNVGTMIGQMNYVRWKQTYDLLRKNQVLPTNLDVTEAYTGQFTKDRY